MGSVHGLGFCVSIEHARFMSDYFNEKGIPSIALTSGSSDDERATAKAKLLSGEIKFIFDLHCTYTRDQILVAMDFMKPNTVREGTKWLEDKKVDVFFITLNKSDKDYSPTTMYEDYSINEEFFHWQSQSTTSDTSPTGQRYINHVREGNKVLLFVREFKKDMAGAAPYTYLGTAKYVSHYGNRPMSITWRLDNPIPAKYIKKTSKLEVG